MSREKQIEEMAKHCPCYFGEKCCIDGELPERCDMLCQFGTYAEILYNAGYRKQNNGMWFHYSTTMMECSICRKHTPIRKYDFCPRCGANMKGGAE